VQDAGIDAAPDGPVLTGVPEGCDPSADPKDAPACVVNEYGVFVDATAGNDSNAGTRESPVKSIGTALGKLSGKPRVYICDGTYAEHVKLTSAVSLFGGFACGAWTYSGTKAKIAPQDVGYALEVSKVSGATAIADLAFAAQPGTEAAPSSIAAFVSGSPAVTFRRVTLTADKGASAAAQPKAANGTLMSSTPTASTLNGNAGDATNGGAAQSCTCANGGTSKGGNGGNVGIDGVPGETAQSSPNPATATGEAGTVVDCAAGSGPHVNGRPGSDAPNASAAVAITKLGTLSEAGWQPEAGADGANGPAGQGGGGGGGSAGGGGGGACGGCGGDAGKGGAGGGASVALLALDSPVTLAACTLTTADAGAGGAGGAGGDGAGGGIKGARGGAACDGGNGGKGGNGGAGAGGAGGISAGVLYKGAKPTIDATITIGAKGAKGAGGVPGTNDGLDGDAKDSLEIQ
jgi:hypothetical protein